MLIVIGAVTDTSGDDESDTVLELAAAEDEPDESGETSTTEPQTAATTSTEPRTSTTTTQPQTTTTTTTQPQTTTTTTTQPGIGDPVRDGNFEFVVTKIYEPTNVQAFDEPLGIWVAVDLTVANIKDKTQSYSAADQTLIFNDGEYDPSWTLSDDLTISINPGLSTDTTVYYDVPESVLEATTVTMELHDSLFSGGARVVVVPDWAT